MGRVISLISNQAAAAIDLIELLEANRRLALHDGLTNLLNRRAFDDSLERSVSQAARAEQPLSLLMLDLDHFKQLNDTYGHATGDVALQAAAAEIRLQVRGGDLAARYGGEEFAIILPDTDGPAAFRMAERLRKALSERVVKAGKEQIKMTASCGVSATDLGYSTPEELIHSADEALYASKETGRNRTSLAGAPRRLVTVRARSVVKLRPSGPLATSHPRDASSGERSGERSFGFFSETGGSLTAPPGLRPYFRRWRGWA